MNKGRRNELRDLKWKRRLKNLGLKRDSPKAFICYRDQGKPCSCAMCSPRKAEGDKNRYKKRYLKTTENRGQAFNHDVIKFVK